MTAILLPCLLQGGTEIQTLFLSSVLRSLGNPVRIICYFEWNKEIVSAFERTGAEVKLMNLKRNISLISLLHKLKSEIRSFHPDVVHIQYLAPGALPIIAARIAGVKAIFATVHQPYIRSYGWFSKMILRLASVLTTKFMAVSQNTEKSWFGTSCLFDESKPLKFQPHHFTIHNAVDLDKIQKIVRSVKTEDLRAEVKIPDGIPVIGTVSRLRQEKGIDVLIKAFDLLIRGNYKAHLLIVGSGPDEDKLKEQVNGYNLSGKVIFYGASDWETTIRIMSVMDIVVVPSRYEGFGLAAAEAMAAGKPVVATDTSGLKEVIINGQTGILFPVDDTRALKEAMKRLINDGALRERFGKKGKDRVAAHFSLDLYSKKIKALYGNSG